MQYFYNLENPPVSLCNNAHPRVLEILEYSYEIKRHAFIWLEFRSVTPKY